MKSVAQPGFDERTGGATYGEHRSANIFGGLRGWGGVGSFKPSPPEAESFYTYTKAKFYRLYACFTLYFRITVYKKKLFENPIFKRTVSFCQLTNTDLRRLLLLLCLHDILIVALNHHYILVIQLFYLFRKCCRFNISVINSTYIHIMAIASLETASSQLPCVASLLTITLQNS